MYFRHILSVLAVALTATRAAPFPNAQANTASTDDSTPDNFSAGPTCPPNTSCLPSPVGKWTSLAPIPIYRQEHRSIAIQGQIYVFGGVLVALPNGTFPTTGLNQKYSIADDAWTTVAPLPIPMNHINGAKVNGKIYVLGGMVFQDNFWVAVRDCFMYDPAADAWTAIGQVPKGRQAGSAAVGVKGTTIYLAGGISRTNLTTYQDETVKMFTSYDVNTQTWTNLPDMPAPRDHAGVGLIGGKLYVLGGRANNAIGKNGNMATAFAYDLSAGTWDANLPHLPGGPRAGISSGVVGTMIYCIGGEGNPAPNTNGVFPDNAAYDTSAGTWSTYTPMAVPRHGTSAVVVNKRIYVPGGGVSGGGNPTFQNDYYQAA